ncbi:MAG TPA: DUF4270 domain-containing protein [Paludibacteraceae bacterium]|nr:DUF4270 domain-containing protein [Paludibacteraceae bacterium]
MHFNKFFLFLFTLAFVSCTDGLTDIGVSILPSQDIISVNADAFDLNTENVFVDFIYTRQDSFLLGNFYDRKYGSTRADILAQVNCPVDFTFPDNAVPDSAVIALRYLTWFGDKYSPMEIKIYQMNKATFSYSEHYPSNINPDDYTDRSILLGKRIITPSDTSGSRSDGTQVRFKLSDSFVQWFFPENRTYNSQKDFLQKFKGMFITTTFGSANILYVNQIDLYYYYHYTYVRKTSDGSDSTVTVNNVITFPANAEVRQVNRIQHPDRNEVVQSRPEVNYVASPANINTRISLPVDKIAKQMKTTIHNKYLSVNSALLKVEVTEQDEATIAVPLVQNMMLIKESALDRFFKNSELPSDTCALIAQYSYTKNADTNSYDYYYTFNLSKLIANEIKKAETNGTQLPETMDLLLVPVTVQYNNSGYYTSVKHQILLSGVTIKSGKNTSSPMKINLVYSGF